MGNLVVKSNAFIGASYGLGVVEQRLIFLAILKARENDSISENIGKKLTIHASDYMTHFGVDRAT
ncbi:RepB family plasmid replication initiator protein, partial [Streptococcus pneumoniae]|uniref:RepB family plasmid replication initiator protein n=1 Tax=Streptococcus pneumoniae TaxID=1313 RepID=UPI0013DD82F0